MSRKKVYIALTAGQGCLWGAGISEDAGKESLGEAYGELGSDSVVVVSYNDYGVSNA